jgi:hypothetical protein
MRTSFLLLCEGAGWTHHGSPILYGLFRAVGVTGFPAHLPPMFLAMEVECDPHETGVQPFILRMIDEDGATVAESRLEFMFNEKPGMGPNYAFFAEPLPGPIPIHGPGIYRIDLLWREETLGQLTFEVNGPPE